MSSTARGPYRHTNRLITQASPYLLQHAHNPVDWWPWGPDAFAEARRRDVPILLSVGYSTCYWCHVMERESFENEAIAAIMNRHFVCIKLDREERPDVDDLYMTTLLMTRGSGGWPMNCFLEPTTLKPFWCGTYFPPQPRMNLPGWPQVLENIAEVWRSRRDDVVAQADRVAEAVREHLAFAAEPAALGEPQITETVQRLLALFDRAEGGFGTAPKFPQPAYLEFLLDVRAIAADDDTRAAIDEAVRRTLDRMAIGGIFDQIGGGFHRYSVDARWTVPHFEKMLYDNAQLAAVYTRAWECYREPLYERTARRTLDYILREMTGPRNEFHTAQDAEVDGREGLNYVWTPEQIRGSLPPEDAEFAIKLYGLDQGPNFQDPHHPDEPPVNVLRLSDTPAKLASAQGVPVENLLARMDAVNAALLAARSARPQPGRDDKVLTAWNGLAIGAFALAGRIFQEPMYIRAAERAADFIWSTVRHGQRLARSWRAGTIGIAGVLEDSALLLGGLLELSRSVPGSDALPRAVKLAEAAHHDFADQSGRYFDTRADQSDLFVRSSSATDGVIPSGQSAMLHALMDLALATGEPIHIERAAGLLASLSAAAASSPISTINTTRAVLRAMTSRQLAPVLSALPTASTDQQDQPGPASNDFSAVEIYAAVDRVELAADAPASLKLVVNIAEGYHVIAADPGTTEAPLVPFRVGIIGGTGMNAYAEYPAGEQLELPGMDPVRVYHGTFEFEVALERDGEWTGRPMLAVGFQACSDAACQRPRTVELDVSLDRA